MNTGKIHSIPNVDEDNRQRLAQKIRSAAQRAKIKVTVRYSKSASKLYFQKIEDRNAPQASDATPEGEDGNGRKNR